jgi:hypothetical protein
MHTNVAKFPPTGTILFESLNGDHGPSGQTFTQSKFQGDQWKIGSPFP